MLILPIFNQFFIASELAGEKLPSVDTIWDALALREGAVYKCYMPTAPYAIAPYLSSEIRSLIQIVKYLFFLEV
ncbi:hypothetical protein [Microseira wollei]|uniref:hypothetical protein n=1 Tax=Microseira wollei TaxID=467598 RepID=UPI001CFE96E1|nr:hypothetical protein [Microseira wollei]